MFTLFRTTVVIALLAISPGYLFALELTIVDQHGNALSDAFVAIPSGEVSSPSAKPAVMDQVDVKFVPHVLAIDKGQSVIFPNSDNIRHHVYSFSDPKRFEIKLYDGVPNTPIEFDQPGLVALGCNIHDSMLGYIFVSPWPSYRITGDDGVVRFDQASDEVAIWHPWQKGKTEPVRIDISKLTNNHKATVKLNVIKPTPRKSYKNDRRHYYD